MVDSWGIGPAAKGKSMSTGPNDGEDVLRPVDHATLRQGHEPKAPRDRDALTKAVNAGQRSCARPHQPLVIVSLIRQVRHPE